MFSIVEIYRAALEDLEITDEMVENGIVAIRQNPTEIEFILKTPLRKDAWYQEAKIIIAQDDSVIRRYIIQLLDWLVDINWPGADMIYDRIARMPLTEDIEKAIVDSIKWAENLGPDKLYLFDWIATLRELHTEMKK